MLIAEKNNLRRFLSGCICPIIGGAFLATVFFWAYFVFNELFFKICYYCGIFLSLITVYDRDYRKMPKKLAFFMTSNVIFYVIYFISSFLNNYYSRITGTDIYSIRSKSTVIEYFGIMPYIFATEIFFLILFSASFFLFRKKRLKLKNAPVAEITIIIISALMLIIAIIAAVNINNTEALLWFTNLFRVVDCC